MSAAAMVNRCFRRQHPEAFGDPEVATPEVSLVGLISGGEYIQESGDVLPIQEMGNGERIND